jgi:Cys-tRNA(Pro)/Cys-tRNA(Cys) deacylase
MKTNAMRMLEQGKIPYSIKEYEVDVDDLSGVHAAKTAGLNPDEVFKTLVLEGDKTGYFTVILRVADELDLKKTAKLSNNKSCDLVPVKDLEKLTGYIRGGCSPIGMKKKFPTYASNKLKLIKEVYISAGKRGVQLHLDVNQLIAFCQMTLGDVTKDSLPYD